MLVFCAGTPKAGSTLQYNVCKELLGDTLMIDYGWVPRANEDGFKPEWGDAEHHTILKTHRVPRWVDDVPLSEGLRIVSSYRDLRDVAASGREFRPQADFDEILSGLDLAVEESQRLERLETCLMQRYEDMMVDLEGMVAALADHLGCETSAEQIQQTAARWHVDAVKERLASGSAKPRRPWRRRRKNSAAEKPWDDDTLLWPTHVSSSAGRPGRYERVLTDEEVATIEERYADWLAARGYAVTRDTPASG